MQNPIRGVLLNGQFHNYTPGSFKEVIPLSNSSEITQSSKTFTVLGSRPRQFTITLDLANNYSVKFGTSWVDGIIGATSWTGISRKADLETTIGALGTSLPILFVVPYGVTYSVVPIGQIEPELFIPENPESTGYEFRVSLSFEAIS